MLIKRRQRRRKRLFLQFEYAGLGFGAALSLLLVATILLIGAIYTYLTADLPSLDLLPILLNPENGILLQPTHLYDRSGDHLLLSIEDPGIHRRYLPLDPESPEHLSPQLIQATIALVDPTFWQNPGYAWWSLTAPDPVTLVEHFIMDMFLEKEPPSLRRSLRLRLLAAQLVAEYGRTQVLEWYLNSAYYGHLTYSADSAAQLYLGKSASKINLSEAVLLVKVAEAPALNPLDAPTAAIERQKSALAELSSQGVIGSEEIEQAQQTQIKLHQDIKEKPNIAYAFTDLVIEQLSNQLGRKLVERGGLNIITTLDYELQLEMICTARTHLERLTNQHVKGLIPDNQTCNASRLLPTLPPGIKLLPPDLAVSAVLLDLESGHILAMLGDSTTTGERHPLANHQPGSLFTPFAAVASFSRGLGPATLVWDIPSSLPEDLEGRQNPDGTFHGPQRLRMALANDYLVPLAQILNQIGAANVWRLVEPLGLRGLASSEDPSDLIFANGYQSPLEIAQAYSTFANLGTQIGQRHSPEGDIQPITVLSVEDQSRQPLIEATLPQKQTVLSPELAYLVHNILSDETARWPSFGYPNPLEIGRPLGAKIGQIASGKEVWAVGYTPQLLLVTWSGLPDNSTTATPLDPKIASSFWHALIQNASRDLPPTDWTMPAGVSRLEVCDPSGELPTEDCPIIVSEVFLNGNEPTQTDNLYRTIQINRETGQLATVFTPLELIEERIFLMIPPEAYEWAVSSGLPLPPTAYDIIQVPPASPDVQITSPALFSYVHGKVTVEGIASGEGFTSYRLQVGQGLNPSTWVQIDKEVTTPVINGPLGLWETGQDGLYAMRLVVTRQDQRIENATIQVTVDNTPPQVWVSYPSPGQRFRYPTEQLITLQANVEEAINLDRLEWFLDKKFAGETSQPPYSLFWEATPGEYTLVVKAYDLAGNTASSSPVTFYIEH